MRSITIIMAYYENYGMLKRQYDNFRSVPKEYRKNLKYIVVDDGSPNKPALSPDPQLSPMGFALYRMQVDIPWNQDACRNLGVMQSEPGWILLTDMDHLIPINTIRHVLEAQLDPNLVYLFGRVSEPALGIYKPHPNSFLMTKAMYDKAGGYDERFAGIYGTDGRFRNQLNMISSIQYLPVHLIRVPREVTPDASSMPELEQRDPAYNRQNPDHQLRKVKIREKIGKNAFPIRNLFPWEQVV